VGSRHRAVVLRQNDLVRTGSGASAEIHFADGTSSTCAPTGLITVEESSQNPVSRQQRVALRSSPVRPTSRPRPAPSGQHDDLDAHGAHDRRARHRGQHPGRPTRGPRVCGSSAGRASAETRTGQKIALASNEGVRVDAGGTAGPKVALPSVPQLTAPSNGDRHRVPRPGAGHHLLLWNVVPGASRLPGDGGLQPLLRPAALRPPGRAAHADGAAGPRGGSYFWKVAAVGTDGTEGSFSDVWRFTLARPPRARQLPAARLRDRRAQGQRPARERAHGAGGSLT